MPAKPSDVTENSLASRPGIPAARLRAKAYIRCLALENIAKTPAPSEIASV